jgi:23S rRNA (adenine2503-C2)-methyltransferase
MATVLDIAKRNPNAAPVAVSDAARVAGNAAIEKTAELTVVAGAAPGGASLVGLTRDQLKDSLAAIGVPERELKMRVAQLWHWIYFRGARDFAEMSNVGKGLRAKLAEAYTLARPQVVSEQVSKDGTRKWLIRMASTGPFDKGAEIECV